MSERLIIEVSEEEAERIEEHFDQLQQSRVERLEGVGWSEQAQKVEQLAERRRESLSTDQKASELLRHWMNQADE